MPRVGLILSGCGHQDGSDLLEAVLLMAALDRAGADCVSISTHDQQALVFNHYEGKPSEKEFRNMIFESARLAGKDIREISQITMDDLDALVVPGGLGMLRNFSDFLDRGAECGVHIQVERLFLEAYKLGKPLGAVSQAAVLVAAAFHRAENVQVKVTIGGDSRLIDQVHRTGARHQECEAHEICPDLVNRIVTTPGNLAAGTISEIEKGIDRLVEEVLAMI